MASDDLKTAPGPWKCRVQVFNIPLYVGSAVAKDLPAHSYSLLEGSSRFASSEAGRCVGGLGNLMALRYHDSPVGSYSEFAIIPGQFAYPIEVNGKRKEEKRLKITRIYVSSKDSVFNGRRKNWGLMYRRTSDWNIPKHLARFEWTDREDGATHLKVFPHDMVAGTTESEPSEAPFFQMTFKATPFIPAMPVSTNLYKLLGMEVGLVQPPLPQGNSKELVGTHVWHSCDLYQYSAKTHVGWYDLDQRDAKGDMVGKYPNFWPGGRWRLGIRMDDAVFDITEGEQWETLKTVE